MSDSEPKEPTIQTLLESRTTRRNILKLVGVVTVGAFAGSVAGSEAKKLLKNEDKEKAEGSVEAVQPYIVDYRFNPQGDELKTPPELFGRIVNDPKVGFIFEFRYRDEIYSDAWPYLKNHLQEIQGFAMQGKPEMILTTNPVFAENEPSNQIELDVRILEERRILVKAKNPDGFPPGNQIAIVLPDNGFYEAWHTFTQDDK